MKQYELISIRVISLDEQDCVRTSGENFSKYNDNELPWIPFTE